MRKITMLVLLLLPLMVFASGQDPRRKTETTPQKGPCDAATTQLDMNQCYGEQFHKADARLNKVYGSLLRQMPGEAPTQKVKVVQKAWIRYRDLHCEAAKSEFEGGSMSPMVWAQCMAMTTNHRIEEIKAAYETGERRLE